MDAVCRSNNFHYCRKLLHLFDFQIKVYGKVLAGNKKAYENMGKRNMLKIEFLYYDKTTCERCASTDKAVIKLKSHLPHKHSDFSAQVLNLSKIS